jgi:hypothetical protein
MLKNDYYGEQINITEGDLYGEIGIFIKEVGWDSRFGLICLIDIDGVEYKLPSDNFVFDDYNIEKIFLSENCNVV